MAGLNADEADEVVGERVVVARVEGLAQELRVAAQARDVLLKGREAPGVGFLLLSSESRSASIRPARSMVPCAAACFIASDASPLVKQLLNSSSGMRAEREAGRRRCRRPDR